MRTERENEGEKTKRNEAKHTHRTTNYICNSDLQFNSRIKKYFFLAQKKSKRKKKQKNNKVISLYCCYVAKSILACAHCLVRSFGRSVGREIESHLKQKRFVHTLHCTPPPSPPKVNCSEITLNLSQIRQRMQ